MDVIHGPTLDAPSSDSPSLALVHPTADEKSAIRRLTSDEWRGPLSRSAYFRREEFIHSQPLTRDGGVTFWALVDTSTHTFTARRVIASCETYRKRALVTKGNGKVEDVVSHGIGNVFCDPQLRGRGYAARMMKEIGEKLYTWQQDDGIKVDFTVLYSDIGKVGGLDSIRSRSLVMLIINDVVEILCKIWMAGISLSSYCAAKFSCRRLNLYAEPSSSI